MTDIDTLAQEIAGGCVDIKASTIWPRSERYFKMREIVVAALTTHFEQQRERDAKARKLIERIQAACGDPDKGRGMRNILEFSSLALALLKEEA